MVNINEETQDARLPIPDCWTNHDEAFLWGSVDVFVGAQPGQSAREWKFLTSLQCFIAVKWAINRSLGSRS